MTQLGVPARFYDGETAAAHDVRLQASLGQLWIKSPDGGTLARWPAIEVEPSGDWGGRGPFGVTCRSAPEARLLLADRAGLEALRRLVPELGKAQRGRWRRATLSVIGGACATALAVFVVFDLAPASLGLLVPSSWLERIGAASVEVLAADHPLCAPGAGPQALEGLANRLAEAAGHEGPIRVDILDLDDMNAFAVPGDRIVVLRGLIDRTDPDELAAVLAHEVGHVVERHAHESVVRALGAQALLQLIVGGAGLDAATVAAAVVELSYSRAAEEEADLRAVELLRAEGLHAFGLRTLFLKLGVGEGGSFDWLSTHPARVERAAAAPADAAGADPFAEAEYRAIRSACG